MSDPCPQTVFDPTPDWAGVSLRRTVADWVLRAGDIPGEAVLLPLLALGLAAAGFLVLRALAVATGV